MRIGGMPHSQRGIKSLDEAAGEEEEDVPGAQKGLPKCVSPEEEYETGETVSLSGYELLKLLISILSNIKRNSFKNNEQLVVSPILKS